MTTIVEAVVSLSDADTAIPCQAWDRLDGECQWDADWRGHFDCDSCGYRICYVCDWHLDVAGDQGGNCLRCSAGRLALLGADPLRMSH